jgi:hypothetical protein
MPPPTAARHHTQQTRFWRGRLCGGRTEPCRHLRFKRIGGARSRLQRELAQAAGDFQQRIIARDCFAVQQAVNLAREAIRAFLFIRVHGSS